ncbi:LysR family transcriptional regulator [Chimaeribacter californicus]|uniref:LysR family transcriptional regulator n=1 Tax=Chimaeribacter californicus TaxID=2060067 RepID=A0A2N5EBS8_9GAMM|nr:LysR family transcriptional regulator [Chimaeribacter californicus]PLR39559.1 LysR family transcriptional regulator [Chimaeribacter californicus]
MDFTQLEYFRAAAMLGSITGAARQLHKVPSNITTRIRQLEEELGCQLFIREKQRIHLSAEGKNFLGYATRLLELAEEGRRSIQRQEPGGLFTLGAVESTAAIRLPDVMAAYHNRYPNVTLELFTGLSDEVTESVINWRYAAAFTDVMSLPPELEGIPLYKEKMVLISARDHAPIHGPQDVTDDAVFAFRNTCSYRRRLGKWFDEGHVQPKRIVEIESYHSMLACVSTGAGIALIQESVLQTLPGAARVTAHALTGDNTIADIWLIWRKGTRNTNLDALIGLLDRQYPSDS